MEDREVRETVKEVLLKNGWLNGLYDMAEGDPVAIMKDEDFKKVNNVDSLDELWRNLKDYVGTFRYRRLLFFNDWRYGCFVYRIGEPDGYVEHLTVGAMSFESFRRTVERLMRDVLG